MRMSTSTHTFSLGSTWLLPECLARIFSVMVMPGIENAPVSTEGQTRPTSIGDEGLPTIRTGGRVRQLVLAVTVLALLGAGQAGTAVDWEDVLGPSTARLPAPQETVRWRGDLAGALREAQAENRPLFVTLRCLPCKQCSAFDKNVLEGGSDLDPLLEQFVTVR